MDPQAIPTYVEARYPLLLTTMGYGMNYVQIETKAYK